MAKYEDWLTEEGLLKIEGWAKDGLNDEQIAHNIGIGVRTFYEWLSKYKQLKQVLKQSKEVVDREVENALLKSAIGYYLDEERIDSEGNVYTVRRFVPPNTTAQIFWLKNRKPNEWRDKKQTELTGANGGNLVIGWSENDKEN